MDIIGWLFGTTRRRRSPATIAKSKVRKLVRQGRTAEARLYVRQLRLKGKMGPARAASSLLPRKRRKRPGRGAGYFTMNKHTGGGKFKRRSRSFNGAGSGRKSPSRIGAYSNPVKYQNYRPRTRIPTLTPWEIEEAKAVARYKMERDIENELNMSGLGG